MIIFKIRKFKIYSFFWKEYIEKYLKITLRLRILRKKCEIKAQRIYVLKCEIKAQITDSQTQIAKQRKKS